MVWKFEQHERTSAVGVPTRRRGRWLFALLALLMALAVWAAYAIASDRLPPHLKPFDQAKAAQLTPEKRAEYERELFSELQSWTRPTRRYPTGNPLYPEREQRWQEMADDGFELAHIVLRVVQPSTGRSFNPDPAMRRLVQLAEQGDQGAMCLMIELITAIADRVNWRSYTPATYKWMKIGADLDHPQCMDSLGGKLLLGVESYVQDIPKGKELLFSSIQKGYLNASSAFVLYYEKNGFEEPSNLARIYCWNYWHAKTRLRQPDESIRFYIKYKAPESDKPRLQAELERLQNWHPNIEECIAISAGE